MPKQSKKQNTPKLQSGGKRKGKGRQDRVFVRVGPNRPRFNPHPRPRRPRPRPRTTVVCNIM